MKHLTLILALIGAGWIGAGIQYRYFTAPTAFKITENEYSACIKQVEQLFNDTCGEADSEKQAECIFDSIKECGTAHEVIERSDVTWREQYRKDFDQPTAEVVPVGLLTEREIRRQHPDLRVLVINGYERHGAACFRYPKMLTTHTDCFMFEDITEH